MKNFLAMVILGMGYLSGSIVQAQHSDIVVDGERALVITTALENTGAFLVDSQYHVQNVYCANHTRYTAYHCLFKDQNQMSKLFQEIGSRAYNLYSALDRAGLRNGIDAQGTLYVAPLDVKCALSQMNQATCTISEF